LNSAQLVITKTRIGHEPDFRQGVASRHASAYSDLLCRKRHQKHPPTV